MKSGHVKSGDVRDLRGTLQREKATMGVFIPLEEPKARLEKAELENKGKPQRTRQRHTTESLVSSMNRDAEMF